MASLIENLIEQMNQEYAIYEQLLEASRKKTSAIVANDLDRLREATDKEQFLVDAVTGVANLRNETLNNIASVINKRPSELKVTDVVDFLETQPAFRDPLAQINEKLAKIARQLKDVNAHNQNLIQESLSMIQYNINLLQSLNRAPETAEYSRDMFKNQGGQYGPASGRFDAKQ